MDSQIITCPTCEKHVPLESLQGGTSSTVTIDDAVEVGYTLIGGDADHLQSIINRGECKCNVTDPEKPESNQMEGMGGEIS